MKKMNSRLCSISQKLIAFPPEHCYKFSHLRMSYNSLSCDELVRACAESGNTEAWQEFICRFGPLINRVVMRVARRYGERRIELIEELAQETYSKFCANDCKLLRNFEHRHQNAFYGMAAT